MKCPSQLRKHRFERHQIRGVAMHEITIALADDHNLVRQGLRALLEKEAFVRIVGEASNGTEAVLLVRRQEPDVLILDLMMPVMSGIEVTRMVKQTVPKTRVLILSMHSGEKYMSEALRAGADGYVLKNVMGPELIKAVREVYEGRPYFSSPLSKQAIRRDDAGNTAAGNDPYENLTEREREILHLVGEGLRSREIAERLTITRRTVETHRSNIMRKLGTNNQAGLIRYALQRHPGQG
jgi:DNA-binding NarL/FixJ family response regulator